MDIFDFAFKDPTSIDIDAQSVTPFTPKDMVVGFLLFSNAPYGLNKDIVFVPPVCFF